MMTIILPQKIPDLNSTTKKTDFCILVRVGGGMVLMNGRKKLHKDRALTNGKDVE